MKIYLASRYSRREELCGYRAELEAIGHTVTSRWLNGAHQIADDGTPLGEEREKQFEDMADPRGAALRQSFLQENMADVESADLLIAFTEEPRVGGGRSRGGRHVELGLALAWGKQIFVVGPRENLFCWHESIKQFDELTHAAKEILHEAANG